MHVAINSYLYFVLLICVLSVECCPPVWQTYTDTPYGVVSKLVVFFTILAHLFHPLRWTHICPSQCPVCPTYMYFTSTIQDSTSRSLMLRTGKGCGSRFSVCQARGSVQPYAAIRCIEVHECWANVIRSSGIELCTLVCGEQRMMMGKRNHCTVHDMRV